MKKIPIQALGYGFIPPAYLPEGENEYYLRNRQNRSGIEYRQLNAYEIEVLVRNRNTSDNWNNLLVGDAFTPELVKNCKFYGLVRIGKLEAYYLEYSGLKVPVGLYNSTIISCDFGDNVVIDNVHYLSHYIIGNEVIIVNVNEMLTTPQAKFGNGILKDGEPESLRIWMELCNENGGRSVIPFNGMLAGDAWLWSKYRNDTVLLEKFKAFTEQEFETTRGFYGKVGDNTVIKNCAIIKDVWIGSFAYLKGANKIKNLTISSKESAKSQIGEGCELVNGIVGFGCRIFYGVKAVRFVMASNSQLKYGARLINAYLGDNATISCCEVLNSLIFPAHEQHHNNSFLCASVVMGQSNMAAGATIGSNHNSRSNDGEIVAQRGFWPGLCVSLKHNSRFASFTIIAKGDYPVELDIPLPFSLVSLDISAGRLVVMPAYWFMYNMYALARNAWKYGDRDRRPDKIQHLEFDYLAPDTINEILFAIGHLEYVTGLAYTRHESGEDLDENGYKSLGRELLQSNAPVLKKLQILAEGFENQVKAALLVKVPQAYEAYHRMVRYHAGMQLLDWVKRHSIPNFEALKAALPQDVSIAKWLNLGGQLVPLSHVESHITAIHNGQISSWAEMHDWYISEGQRYPDLKAQHAFAAYTAVTGIQIANANKEQLNNLLLQTLDTQKKLVQNMYSSRAKDYSSPFRKMMYDTEEEMNQVLGPLEKNSFINDEKEKLAVLEQSVTQLLQSWN